MDLPPTHAKESAKKDAEDLASTLDAIAANIFPMVIVLDLEIRVPAVFLKSPLLANLTDDPNQFAAMAHSTNINE